MPANRSSDPSLTKLREDALDLLQWSLDDISPDPRHKLSLEMGLEREGNFVPAKAIKALENCNPHEWKDYKDELLDKIADYLDRALERRGAKNYERIYCDESGTFLIEMTTKALAPKEAARTAIRNSKLMVELAEAKDIEAHFGTMKVPFLNDHEQIAPGVFVNYPGEVFESKDGELLLAGQAQHANVSVWCGDKNLCHQSPYKEEGGDTLGNAMATEAMRMLPGMMLPSRKGNHLRIAGKADLSVQTIDIRRNTKKEGMALNWIDETPSPNSGPVHSYVRMEFRQAAADANPMDVALAAAIPVTRACFDCMKREPGEDGKVILDKSTGLPQIDRNRQKDAKASPMPHSQEEAARMFNKKDNPNFVFLDELAERKLAKLRKKAETSGLATDKIALREAEETLPRIGSRLQEAYRSQYNLKGVDTRRTAARSVY